MKYTICGKGGSGKSTVTTLIAKELSKRGKKVLVIDSDESNYGLHQMLGVEPPRTFVNYFGGKPKVLEMLAGGPQNMPKLFDRPWKIDDIPSEYTVEKDGVKLMSSGKIETADEACACPFNAIMAQFIPALDLSDDEYVLVDMEAGIEHFGRGTDDGTDAIIMVVDPSYESLKLSSKVAGIAEGIGKPVYFVLNKVTDSNEKAMKQGVGDQDRICGILHDNDEIQSTGLSGKELTAGNAEVEKMVDKLIR